MEDAEVVVHFLEPITNTKDLTRHEVAKICEESMRAKLQEIWGDEYIANDANAAEAWPKRSQTAKVRTFLRRRLNLSQ